MALEAWAYSELEKGRPTDDVLHKVLEGHEGTGAVGVAVSVTLEAKHCSEATLPLLTSHRLWRWDIQRRASDMIGGNNLIGFEKKDKRHYDAVVKGNNRQSRLLDIRWLATTCVLSGGDLGAKASVAIQAFANDLPFDYEEDQKDFQFAHQVLCNISFPHDVRTRFRFISRRPICRPTADGAWPQGKNTARMARHVFTCPARHVDSTVLGENPASSSCNGWRTAARLGCSCGYG